MSQENRISELDGIRGIAIILVLIWHYYACQLGPELEGVHNYFRIATRLFWSGVDLFFVLSGFLITGILLEKRRSPNLLSTFYRRRACRILPIYLVLLAAFQAAKTLSDTDTPMYQWLFVDSIPFWSYLTFTQNIFLGIEGKFASNWLGVTWSLAVEEQFYILIPLLFFLAGNRSLAWTFIIIGCLAILLRITLPGFHAFVNTPWRADSLVAGSLLAILMRWPPFVDQIHRNLTAIRLTFLLFVCGAAAMSIWRPRFGQLDHTWLALMYSLFLLLAISDKDSGIQRVLRSACLVWLGSISFSLYMFHQAVAPSVNLLVAELKLSGATRN